MLLRLAESLHRAHTPKTELNAEHTKQTNGTDEQHSTEIKFILPSLRFVHFSRLSWWNNHFRRGDVEAGKFWKNVCTCGAIRFHTCMEFVLIYVCLQNVHLLRVFVLVIQFVINTISRLRFSSHARRQLDSFASRGEKSTL